MRKKQGKRSKQTESAKSSAAYFQYIAMGGFGLLIALAAIFFSVTNTDAVKYTPYPTPVPPGGATPLPTPSTDATDIRIIYPIDNSTVIHNSWVSINTVAQDWDGVAKMEIYADGKYICQGDTTSLSCSWRAGKPGTTHLVEARATDGKGNTAATSIHLTVK